MTVAAVEAGGTKFVCALVHVPDRTQEKGTCKDGPARPEVLARTSIPTGEPAGTLRAVADFYARLGAQIDRIGIGTFGPADLDPSSKTWGFITSTPKPGWRGVDLAGPLSRALKAPAAFDTDVGAAALGEGAWGAGRGLSDFIYVTVGTGIGGGIVAGGRLLHGAAHPEIGHVKVGRIEGDTFPGICPFHGGCLEGLAAGPAIGARWASDARSLADNHPAWDLEARYLARAFAGFAMTLSTRRIIMGGGVGLRAGLAESVRRHLRAELSGYLEALDSDTALKGFVVRAELGADAGILGCAALASSPDAFLRIPA